MIIALMLAVSLGLRIPWKVLLIKGLQLLFILHSFPPLCDIALSLDGQCLFLPCGSDKVVNSAPHQALAVTISTCLAFLIGSKMGTWLRVDQ